MTVEDLKIDIYADGADIDGMLEMSRKPYIKGFTTNPTLMKKAGVTDYVSFAGKVLDKIKTLPVSFEVFADDFPTMKKEAEKLSGMGDNVYVKIPVTNIDGEPSYELIRELSKEGLKLNVTAIMPLGQVEKVVESFEDGTENIVSVFAGRIADAGVDAEEHMRKAAKICHKRDGIRLLWASCREVYNIVQAEKSGSDIITVTNDILKKCGNLGKDLEQFSLETVRMFSKDGHALGFSIL
ncbi:MAG: transaldolase [Lachnospiraceae bacterium]|nr:transaldolase [Lachnospiraceae bacterium]